MLNLLRDSFQNKVFTALTTAWTAINTPDNFTSVGGAITATVLEDAIDQINQNLLAIQIFVDNPFAVDQIIC